MKIKRLVLAVALAASAPLAMAHGVGGGVVIGGGAAGFIGSASGGASSVSGGSATAGSQVLGNGYSIQGAGAISGGSASIGGTVTPSGAVVNTSTTNYALSGNFGATNQQVMSGSTIVNGSQAFGTTKNDAWGSAQFATGGFGFIAGIGGIGGMGSW